MNVVLLHAFPLDSRMWEPQREVLADHLVFTPDLYPLGSTMEEWAQAVLGRLDAEFAVVGASMGGYCALALARLAPDRVRALVLAGSRADPDTPERLERRAATIELIRAGGAEALWEDMQPKLFAAEADPEVVERARQMALEQDPDGLVRGVEAIRDRRDSTDLVKSLGCPVLVVVAEEDPFVPREVAEELARSAAEGRLVVFPGGHLPSLERPAEFNAELRRALDAV